MKKTIKPAATSLEILLTLRGRNYSGIPVEKAREIVETFQKVSGSVRKTAELVGLRYAQVSQLFTELRKAAKEGYTLEAYWEAGRPLAGWKRKIETPPVHKVRK